MKKFLFLIVVCFFLSNHSFSQNISQKEFSNLIKKNPEYVEKYLIFKGWKIQENQKNNTSFKYSSSEHFLDSTLSLKKDEETIVSLKIEFINIKVFDKFKSLSLIDKNFRKSIPENNEIRFVSVDGKYILSLYSELIENKLKHFAFLFKSTY